MTFNMLPYKKSMPKIDNTAYIADNCVLVGDIEIGSNSSVWFNSVLRGDVESIVIGKNTNIQDGCVVHTSRANGPVIIGNDVTVGHLSLIHACTIHDHAFVGMRSTIMDYAIIEEYGFVAAGSLLLSGKIVKSRELWIGTPAKFVRYLTEKDLCYMKDNIKVYVNLASDYLTTR